MNNARHESVWFDRNKYESAEAKYQSLLANRHRGLVVEGKGVSSQGATSQAVSLSTEIGKAMDLIGKSLNNSSSPSVSGELERRVGELEKQNAKLKSEMASVMERLKVIESKVNSERSEIGKVESAAQKSQKAEDGDDDDFDLFGDTDDEEEVAALKEERKKQMADTKAKPKVVAKSSLILDIKPWDDETDLAEMEEKVRQIETDGLLWGASKLLPVAYGIKKLQICCVIEDDKVGTDYLEESIQDFEDYVQSVDIVAFNKI